MLKMALNVAVFGAFVLIVAVLGVFLWNTLFVTKEHGYGSKKGEPSYSQQQSSGKNPLGSSTTPSGQKATDDAITGYTKWLAIFTLFLVLATIGLFISGERSVRVAGRAADAAKESADTSRQALIAVQRAFVFIDVFEGIVVNDEFRIAARWRNSGTTPANPMKNYISWKTFPSEPPPNFDYPDLGPGGVPLPARIGGLPFFIGPEANKYAEILRIPLAIMDQVREGKLRLFVWGWGEYRDVFEADHRTEFCTEVIVTDAGKTPEGKVTLAVSFSNYGPFNTAN